MADPEIDETTPYNCIRARVADHYGEGTGPFLTVMELVNAGLLDATKAAVDGETVTVDVYDEAPPPLCEEWWKYLLDKGLPKYGGHPVGTDETADLSSRSAGRPGGS